MHGVSAPGWIEPHSRHTLQRVDHRRWDAAAPGDLVAVLGRPGADRLILVPVRSAGRGSGAGS
jgi:hypothetical protein